MIAGCLLAAGALPVWGQSGAPTLVIRIDDLGALHSVNEACIQTYRSGIARSVEVMPVAAWYPEAIKMLKENPGFTSSSEHEVNAMAIAIAMSWMAECRYFIVV